MALSDADVQKQVYRKLLLKLFAARSGNESGIHPTREFALGGFLILVDSSIIST